MKSEKQRRLKTLQAEIIPDLKATITEATRALEMAKQEAADIALSLVPKTSEKPKISDHALVRYMERKHGFNLDNFREEILTPDRVKMIEAGCKSIKVDGITFKVEGKTVVTCID